MIAFQVGLVSTWKGYPSKIVNQVYFWVCVIILESIKAPRKVCQRQKLCRDDSVIRMMVNKMLIKLIF